MTRAYLAMAQPDERRSLKLLLADQGVDVVGEAGEWRIAARDVPRLAPEMVLTDWDLIPSDSVTAVADLRASCPSPIVVVLISQLGAREQAALSAGADSFISKGERPTSVAEHLRAAVHAMPAG